MQNVVTVNLIQAKLIADVVCQWSTPYNLGEFQVLEYSTFVISVELACHCRAVAIVTSSTLLSESNLSMWLNGNRTALQRSCCGFYQSSLQLGNFGVFRILSSSPNITSLVLPCCNFISHMLLCFFQPTRFIPPYGTSTTLRLTSKIPTPDVVKMILTKFQVSIYSLLHCVVAILLYVQVPRNRFRMKGQKIVGFFDCNCGVCRDGTTLVLWWSCDGCDDSGGIVCTDCGVMKYEP